MTPPLIVYEPWRPHPLAWIHRVEARGIAAELRRSGHGATCERYDPSAQLTARTPILRLSDPVMLAVVKTLSSADIRYIGPGGDALARCYDKHTATGIIARAGFATPETVLGSEADRIAFPAVIKPRRGSDSMGTRLYRHGPIPAKARNDRYIVQRYVRGSEITVAVLNGRAGAPLHVLVPDGALYSFARKYVLRPSIVPLADRLLAGRAQTEAVKIAATLGVDWAARIDFIRETQSGRLCFLECDVAPLIGLGSAFERSLSAAGVDRTEQLGALFKMDSR